MNIFKTQPFKIALGIVIGLGVIIVIALAIDANSNHNRLSQNDAGQIALREAGVSSDQVSSLDISDKNTYYTVTFVADGKSYSYDVNKSGDVVRASFVADGNTDDLTDALTKDEAQSIALADAGIKAENCEYLNVHEDRENGQDIYDVEFYSGGFEYDYEIAKDGRIIKKDYDIENYQSTNTDSDIIGYDKAKEIALARVEGATDQNIRIEFDHDDGYPYYEGEIYYNGMEYEFEIDGYTGNVIEWSVDRD